MSQSEDRPGGPLSAIWKGNVFPRGSQVRLRQGLVGQIAFILIAALIFSPHPGLQAQDDKSKGADKPSATSSVRIEVTGGDENKPVADASIYLKYVKERKLLKDQTVESDLKTNQEGVTHIPNVPKGKVLIQIVASSWKTYGEYFDINQDEQTIQIHLVRPPTKWY